MNVRGGDDAAGAAGRVTAVRARIEGRVQGVFFRVSTRQAARSLGLTGWVRNLPDGAVEAFLQGPAGAIDQALDWCREGPPGARVDRVEVRPADPDGRWTDFSVRG
ncbi:MAG: acylphosphatase [Actinobacteria bacterium]|nr:acylphosphatase [Actinomycetota bacterium]